MKPLTEDVEDDEEDDMEDEDGVDTEEVGVLLLIAEVLLSCFKVLTLNRSRGREPIFLRLASQNHPVFQK